MHRHVRQLRRDDGFTLAEMMVAIFVVGFVLSAMAATLLSTLRATSTSERETRATAIGQQEIEVLQSVNWEYAALYASDVTAAEARWSDRLDDAGRFDELELITLPGPTSAASRVASVAAPSSTITAGGVDYTIDRYVTWMDRSQDATPDTRRFTVVVTWDDRDSGRGITVTAERAPAQGDVTSTASGTRVLQMHVSPNPAQLDEEQALTEPVFVRVVLNQASPSGNELRYYALDDAGDWELRTLTPTSLSPEDVDAVASAPNTRFRFELPAGERFVAGVQNLLYIGRDAANQPIEASRSVTFEGGTVTDEGMPSPVPPTADDPSPIFGFPPGESDDEPLVDEDGDPIVPPSEPVRFTSVSANNTHICVDPSTWVPNRSYEVTMVVTGMPDPIGKINVTYQTRTSASGHPAALTTVTDGAVFVSGTSASATYRFTLPTVNRYFSRQDKPTFTLAASRDGDSSNATRTFKPSGVKDNC